ncbi:MAG: efflux RND transporter periplasmic adaptor subunit [Acidobacteria bacterium]|jgi:RND family efflux transporter MFP subunit|nr:efflux RND transporter periplasmic adaptor subunit [Acidobacteriota bacterium]
MSLHHRLRLVLSFLVLLSACGGSEHSATPPSGSQNATGPVATVVTACATRGTVEDTLETFGTVEFDPHETRTVAFVRSGQVRQLLVTPGQPISKGDPLLELGPLPSSSTEVEQARINLKFAQRNLQRVRRLLKSHLATNETVQQAEKQVADARATLVGLGVDAGSDSQTMLAPFAGVVVEVSVTSGAIVNPGEAAFLVAPAGGLAVRAGFEPEDATHLKPGMAVHITPVFESAGQPTVDAVLARLHRVADPRTQLLEALIRPRRIRSWMVAGTRVRVDVVVRAVRHAIRIPRDALVERGGRPGVYVVESGSAHWRQLRTGIETDRWIEVLDGIEEGATVVTTGRTSLSDGMAVAEPGTSGGH